MPKRSFLAFSPARYLCSAVLILALGGCQTTGLEDVTGALGGKQEPVAKADNKADAKPEMDALRERYRAKPSDPAIALEYGNAGIKGCESRGRQWIRKRGTSHR